MSSSRVFIHFFRFGDDSKDVFAWFESANEAISSEN